MTLLLTDPLFLNHQTGQHPERPERLRAIAARLAESGLDRKCLPGTFQPLPDRAIAEVHSEDMIARARQLARQGGGYLDSDTVLSADSFEVARAAAGAGVAAVDAIVA